MDHAKRHLTTSITTLNHLHMLAGGVDSLEWVYLNLGTEILRKFPIVITSDLVYDLHRWYSWVYYSVISGAEKNVLSFYCILQHVKLKQEHFI